MKKYILFCLATLCSLYTLNAQTLYEVYAPLKDSIKLVRANCSTKEDTKPVYVSNGDELYVVGKDFIRSSMADRAKEDVEYSYYEAVVQLNNNLYRIKSQYLYLSDKNSPDAIDYSADMACNAGSMIENGENINFFSSKWRPRDKIGHMLYSYKVHTVVLILTVILLALILTYSIAKKYFLFRAIYTFALPIIILLISAIEFLYFAMLFTEVSWWIDFDKLGLIGVFKPVLGAAFVIIVQYYSMGVYGKILVGQGNGEKLSFAPIVWGTTLFLPVTIVLFIALVIIGQQLEWGISQSVFSNYAFLIGGAMYFIFFLASIFKNRNKIGLTNSILFSIFTVPYALGLAVLLSVFIICGFKIFLMILSIVIPAIIVIALIGSRFMADAFQINHSYSRTNSRGEKEIVNVTYKKPIN